MVQLADYTTIHVGGSPGRFIQAHSEGEIIDAVAAADAANRSITILGGGSNVLFTEKFSGDVLHIISSGFVNDESACAGAWVTVQAGQSWDEFVAHAVEQGWSGIEGLSGIPGTAGATPIQNVGAYGQQVSDVIAQVRVWNRKTNSIETLFASDCEFGYRDSIFKRDLHARVILSVTYQLPLGTMSGPITFNELAQQLGIELKERAPIASVRAAVLALRRSKGMVIDSADHDTWSVGSYFLNPRVTAVPEGAPSWEQSDGTFKVSAAWLIENAGFAKGFGLCPEVTLSTKHTLAITNRGQATSQQVLDLAHHISETVHAKFGVKLEVEPRILD